MYTGGYIYIYIYICGWVCECVYALVCLCVVDTTEATAMAIVVEVVWWQWQKLRERPLHNSEQRDNNRFFSEFSAFSLSLSLMLPYDIYRRHQSSCFRVDWTGGISSGSFSSNAQKTFRYRPRIMMRKQSKTKNKPPKVQDTGRKTIAYICTYIGTRLLYSCRRRLEIEGGKKDKRETLTDNKIRSIGGKKNPKEAKGMYTHGLHNDNSNSKKGEKNGGGARD